jgi:hypothetical protein
VVALVKDQERVLKFLELEPVLPLQRKLHLFLKQVERHYLKILVQCLSPLLEGEPAVFYFLLELKHFRDPIVPNRLVRHNNVNLFFQVA